MAQYTNSTRNSDDWNLYFHSLPYSEGLFILLIFLYRLKIQLWKPNRQRNVKLIKEFQRKMMHLLDTLMNWCAYMQDFDDTHIKKHVINVKVVPYENKTIAKIEKKKEEKHPWDIAQEIMLEQKQAALAVKWAIIPLEVLMDEQFLNVLHAIEEITNATPLREAAKQLPKQIYEIIKSQEQLMRIPAELMDQLVVDVAKTYYYSVIESLCKLIKSIQQGQRTALVSLASISFTSWTNHPGCSLVTLLRYMLQRMISYFMRSVIDKYLPMIINNERKTQPQVKSYRKIRTIYPMG